MAGYKPCKSPKLHPPAASQSCNLQRNSRFLVFVSYLDSECSLFLRAGGSTTALSPEPPSTPPEPPAHPQTSPEVSLELSAAMLIRRGVNGRGLCSKSDVLVTLGGRC